MFTIEHERHSSCLAKIWRRTLCSDCLLPISEWGPSQVRGRLGRERSPENSDVVEPYIEWGCCQNQAVITNLRSLTGQRLFILWGGRDPEKPGAKNVARIEARARS